MSRGRLIVVGPVPPPVHGVHVSTSLALHNALLLDRFVIEHVDTSDHRPISTMEKWDVTNVVLGVRHLRDLIKRLRGPSGVVYLPLSENLAAFLRDSLFIWAASSAHWKVAIHIRNSMFREFYSAQNALVRLWMRSTLRRVDSLAVLGESLRPIFDGLVPRTKLVVVRNGTPDVDPPNISRQEGRVVFLSNLLRRKGVVEAVEAALLVVRAEPVAEVIFAGEWEDSRLEETLRRRINGVGDRIRFLPPVYGAEKEELLASASVLLFPPSVGEGHPRIVLEAICRGIPLVTTNRATIAETVTDGESAFILEDPLPDQLADRVLTLIRDTDLRQRMGQAARLRYLERFTQAHADQELALWLGGLT